MNWILLIALYAADGTYIDKIGVPMDSRASCEAARAQLVGTDKIKPRPLCITRAHWEGRRLDPGVSLD